MRKTKIYLENYYFYIIFYSLQTNCSTILKLLNEKVVSVCNLFKDFGDFGDLYDWWNWCLWSLMTLMIFYDSDDLLWLMTSIFKKSLRYFKSSRSHSALHEISQSEKNLRNIWDNLWKELSSHLKTCFYIQYAWWWPVHIFLFVQIPVGCKMVSDDT